MKSAVTIHEPPYSNSKAVQDACTNEFRSTPMDDEQFSAKFIGWVKLLNFPKDNKTGSAQQWSNRVGEHIKQQWGHG